MSFSDRRSWLDRVVGGCFAVLVAAIALFIAVRLVESVWVFVVGVLAIAGSSFVLIVVAVKSRRQSW